MQQNLSIVLYISMPWNCFQPLTLETVATFFWGFFVQRDALRFSLTIFWQTKMLLTISEDPLGWQVHVYTRAEKDIWGEKFFCLLDSP